MAKYVNVDTIAPEMKVIAIPTRIYDSEETDRIFPSFVMIATTASEKRNAIATTETSEITENPRIIENAAPKADPDATPRVRGDTSGLPRQPCMSTPAVPNAAPPIIAINTRGNLNSHMITVCKSLPSSNPRIIFIVEIGSNVEDDPRPIAMIAEAKVPAHKIAIIVPVSYTHLTLPTKA